MRNTQKRTLSLLVVIALCLSFIVPAVQMPAAAAGTVDYKYSGSYIYNWGSRDETATFLSPNAEAFYTGSDTYEQWAKLSGGATVADVPGSALYNALSTFMAGKQTHETGYKATNDLYQYTDCENNGSPSTISTFYSGKAVGPTWDSGSTWNKEHTWPDSKGDAAGNGENDIMMLRPAASNNNSSRGNKAYGESTGYYDPNSLGQDVRGDAARVVLYTYVRWKCTNTGSDYNTTDIFGTNGVIESKDILLKWMEEDPVDTWEMGRNDAVQSITGTRNVFVDYPQLAFQLFGEEVPANLTTPNGETYETAAPSTGTTPPTTNPETPSGVTYAKVTSAAQLTTGQYVLVVGQHAANVLDGSWVTVVAPTISGDYVTDAKGAVWTLTFDGSSVKLTDANGTTIAPKSGNNNGIQSGDYSWAWTLENGKVSFNGVGSDTTTLAANSGSEYKIRAYKTSTVSGNANGYPNAFELYKLTDSGSEEPPVTPDPEPEQPPVTPDPEPETPSGETYVKVTDAAQLTTGQYVLVVGQHAANVLDGSWVTVVAPTIDGDSVTDAKGAVWTLTFDGSGVKLTDANGTTIAPQSGNTNGIQSGDYSWAWTLENGKVTFNGVGSDTTTLAANSGSEYKIRAYKTSTVSGNANGYPNAFELYKLADSGSEEPPVTPDPEQPPVTPDPEEPTEVTELQTGDQVVIYAPAYNKALSVTKTGNYNVGVDVIIADGAVTGYGETEIFTVTVNEDGTYSFANGGQNIGMADQYTSMNLDAVNDKWEMTALGGTLFNLKNSVRATYMEWYSRYSNWSTYASTSAATDDQFQLSFYVVGEGILTVGGTTPEPDPEPEYPEADTTLTIQEAIALGTPMASNSYTPGKYYVTGVITEVYNTTHGNMYIKDEAGNELTVYGTWDSTGEIRYDALETKPVAGDQVTVYGIIGNYGGKPQMKNGWITAHTPGVEEPPAEPVAPEFPVSDKIIGSVADLLPGTYKMAAYLWKNSSGVDISAAPFHLWDGTVSSTTPDTSNSDLNTESYSFANDTWTAAGTDSAADVVLVAVAGKENTYYIMVGDQYLYSAVEATNRRLALGSDPAEWVATDNANGGITLNSNGVYLGSATANYDMLRSYKGESTLASGVYFFAVDVPKPADPIALKGTNIELGSCLTINFNGLKSVLDQYENVYVIFEVEGRDPVKVTEYFTTTDSQDRIRYNFAYEDVTILNMNLPILATIYGTYNGVEYSYTAAKAMSMLSYCTSMIAKADTDPQTASVCANLLKYAMAAEAYMAAEYGTSTDGHLINVLSDQELAAIETYATPDDQVSVEKTSSHTVGTQVKFAGQSLEMVSRITLRYRIEILDDKLDTSKLTFKVTYTDYNGNAACQDYTFADLEYDAKTGSYILGFSGFNATQMRDMAKCTIYIDGVEHCYYENSIENYCCTAINSTTQSEVVKYLAKRISLYGDACYAAYGKNK